MTHSDITCNYRRLPALNPRPAEKIQSYWKLPATNLRTLASISGEQPITLNPDLAPPKKRAEQPTSPITEKTNHIFKTKKSTTLSNLWNRITKKSSPIENDYQKYEPFNKFPGSASQCVPNYDNLQENSIPEVSVFAEDDTACPTEDIPEPQLFVGKYYVDEDTGEEFLSPNQEEHNLQVAEAPLTLSMLVKKQEYNLHVAENQLTLSMLVKKLEDLENKYRKTWENGDPKKNPPGTVYALRKTLDAIKSEIAALKNTIKDKKLKALDYIAFHNPGVTYKDTEDFNRWTNYATISVDEAKINRDVLKSVVNELKNIDE